MSNFRYLLLSSIGFVSLFSAEAESFQTDAGLIYELDHSSKEAVFSGIAEEYADLIQFLEIPGVIYADGDQFTVTSVAAGCCYMNNSLTIVSVDRNIKSIGANAFNSCSNLKSVVLPDGLTEIGTSGFYKCSSLTSVNLPSSLLKIGDFAFYNTAVTTIEVPENTASIGNGPFSNCKSLSSITVDDNNQYFTSQDGVLFSKDMTRLINYPIGDGKSSYNVPNEVKVIGNNSMRNNPTLISIVFNDGLEKIESSAFTSDVLKTVNLPGSLTSMENQAFAACRNITEFSVAPENQYFKAVDKMLLSKDGSKLIYGVANAGSVNIPEGVKEIGPYAFYYNTSLYTIKLASSTTDIDECAFYYCTNLNSVEFGSSLKTIGSKAFMRCSGLSKVIFPESLRYIGDSGFAQATGLTELTLNDGLEFIGDMAFMSCDGLNKITLPASLNDLGRAIFTYCYGLEEVVCKDGLRKLGDSMFNECYALWSINFPESMEEIGDFALTATAIPDLDLNEGLRTIGAAAFELCSFSDVTIPSTVTNIGDFAFAWNSNLLNFNCGESVVNLGNNSFTGCTALVGVDLNEGLLKIQEGAFSACRSLGELTIPSSVIYVGTGVFGEDKGLSSITLLCAEPPLTDGNLYNELFNGYPYATLTVPESSVEAYKSAPEWGKFTKIIGSTAIETIDSDNGQPSIKAIYDINGVQLDSPVDGINIIRMSDGSTRKIIRY